MSRPGGSPIPLALLALLALASSAGATTIRVPADQPTIQASLDAAAPGDTVLVAPGTYTGTGNRNLDFTGKAVVLRSSAGTATTILDGQHVATLFNFHSGETAAASVEGFTIRNGSDGTVYGGGALLTASSPAFRSCTFAQNPANQGGAIYAEQSSVALLGCVFSSNTAANWGGAVLFLNSTATLTNCSFSSNSAGFGGCLYISGGSVTLTGCTFTGNPASTHGGSIYCRNGASLSMNGSSVSGGAANHGAGIYAIDSSLSIEDCTFVANAALHRGGGIYAENAPSLVIDRCTFTRNETTTGDYLRNGGAALYGWQAQSATITGCDFIENTATGENTGGGAINLLTFAPSTISGCTFSLNTSSSGNRNQYAGALRWGASGSFLSSCTFSDNVAGDGGGAAILSGMTVTGCTFRDNHTEANGGAVSCAAVSFAGGTFSGNTAILDGGAIYYSNQDSPRFTGCAFFENSAARGGGIFLHAGGYPTVSGCTFARNSATRGAGISTWNTNLTLDHSIIAGSPAGEAVWCDGASLAVVSCTDITGNVGGDWIGCIADQYGINGCFAADPLFCAPLAGDFTLAETSPCAPAHSPAGCGLIGALPVGCVAPIGVPDAGAPALAASLRVTPLPLRGDGIIEWTPRATTVLRLYDPAGRLVAARATGGAGRLRWDELIRGRRLPAGVYFLEASGHVTRVPVIR